MLLLLFCITSLSAERVGKILYKGYAEDFNDTTMDVPGDIVAMTEYIYVSHPESLTVLVDTPSIFFIIDHSGSMYEYSYDSASSTLEIPQDPLGNRFKVTRDLIDTLSNKRKFPGIEVGLAVFGSCLYYDTSDAIFQTVSGEPNTMFFDKGGFIPLLKLDRMYNGKLGADIIKEKLETTVKNKTLYVDWAGPDTVVKWEWVDLTAPAEFFFSPGTDINIGFIAAKKAMRASTYKKENHYCIFFSDGEATDGSPMNLYVQGTDVPTTFTIFFTETGQAPNSLVQMNDNIKQNGYSSSNPISTLWPYENTTYDSLMQFLMKNVISIFEQNVQVIPQEIEINGVNGNAVWDGKKFVLPSVVPLTGRTTDFVYNITFIVSYDSITINGDTIPVEIESTVPIDFSVYIDDAMTNPPDSFEVKYWDRTLGMYHNGNEISSINDNSMDELELRFEFDPGDAKYAYTKAEVEVFNKRGSEIDRETFTLDKQGSNNLFSFTFKREINPGNVTVGDGILQHSGFDTLVAVFRNSEKPKLPLDTFEIVIPVNMVTSLKVTKGIYFDNDAEGYVDSLFIGISGGSAAGNVDEIMDAIELPDFRKFTIDNYEVVSSGIAVVVTEKASQPQTYVTKDDKLVVNKQIKLPNGNTILEKSEVEIIDSIAPIIMKADFVDSIILIIQGSQQFISEDNHNNLSVVLSETVEKIEEEKPFTYYSISQDDTYEAKLKPLRYKDDFAEFRVLSVSGADAIKDGDSIRINWVYDNNVVDEVGNNQDNAKNIRREINAKTVADTVYKPAPFELIVKATICDKDIGYKLNSEITAIPEIQEVVKNLKSKNGEYKGIMVITLEPDPVENVSERDRYEGYLNLFDAVGNEIIRDAKMGYHKKNKQLIFVWDGRNQLGREVGPGGYAAIIPVTYYFDNKEERSETKEYVIGVRK